jgi:cytochrome c553
MKNTLIGQLRLGKTGADILNILDAIVADMEQTNIQDVAEHYATITTWDGREVAF